MTLAAPHRAPLRINDSTSYWNSSSSGASRQSRSGMPRQERKSALSWATVSWLPALRLAPTADASRQVSADRTVKIWNTENGEELATLHGHSDCVHGVIYSHDGEEIVSCSADQSVKVWDGNTGKELGTFRGHIGPVRSVALSAATHGSHPPADRWLAGARVR